MENIISWHYKEGDDRQIVNLFIIAFQPKL